MDGVHNAVQEAYNRLLTFQLNCRPFQTPESQERFRQQNLIRTQRAAESLEKAHLEWAQVFEDTNAVGRAVLALHDPEEGYDKAICYHCSSSNSYEEDDPVEWPCATFLAVRNTR